MSQAAAFSAGDFEEFQEIIELFPNQLAGFTQRHGEEKVQAMRERKRQYDEFYVNYLARKQ